MSQLGIIRRVDELGRVVLPIELRRALEIGERDPLEITLEGDSILLRKHQISCIFCAADSDLLDYCGKRVCRACLRSMASLDEE